MQEINQAVNGSAATATNTTGGTITFTADPTNIITSGYSQLMTPCVGSTLTYKAPDTSSWAVWPNWQTIRLAAGLPDKIFFQDASETVALKFGDKTTVVHTHEDSYDRIYGFLLAYFQANCGLTKNKANKYLESLSLQPSQDKKKHK